MFLNEIPEPLLFNPLKHHLGFIRDFTEYHSQHSVSSKAVFLKILRQIGSSVMDIYSGSLQCSEIYDEIIQLLKQNNTLDREDFIRWAGGKAVDFKSVQLSDTSQWVIKFYNHETRWVHIFPARMSPHSLRIKANTLKSAILYQVFVGRDFISEEGLNVARAIGNLSPVKDVFEANAITGMIEILRS